MLLRKKCKISLLYSKVLFLIIAWEKTFKNKLIYINVFLKKVSKQMNILTKKDLHHLSEIQRLCNVITHLIEFWHIIKNLSIFQCYFLRKNHLFVHSKNMSNELIWTLINHKFIHISFTLRLINITTLNLKDKNVQKMSWIIYFTPGG